MCKSSVSVDGFLLKVLLADHSGQTVDLTFIFHTTLDRYSLFNKTRYAKCLQYTPDGTICLNVHMEFSSCGFQI